MLEKFKIIHNEAVPALGGREKYGERTSEDNRGTNGVIQVKTNDPIITRILELLAPKNKESAISFKTLQYLERELVNRFVLHSESPIDYLPVLRALRDSLGKDISEKGLKPFSAKTEWSEAISLIKPLIEHEYLSSRKIQERQIRSNYPKEFDIAMSTKYLVDEFSCKFEINEKGEVNITEGLDKVLAGIDKRIKSIGGLTLISWIFGGLYEGGLYKTFVNRYAIGRRTSYLIEDMKPDIPIGYLLNTSLKYPVLKVNIPNLKERILEIFKISTAYCNSVYKSQPYSTWEVILTKGDGLVQLTKDISIYDTVFSIDQGDLKSEIQTLKILLNFITEEEFQKYCGFSSESFYSVMAEIDHLTENIHIPCEILKSNLCRTLNLKTDEAIAIFKAISNQPKEINSKYETPAYYPGINFWKKPLIKLNDNSFVLANRTWCAKAFYESLAALLRKRPNFDTDLGYSMENAIKVMLKNKGISFMAGNYDQSGVDGECDLVIKTDKDIFLFELKKKYLTGIAKSGNDIDIVIDLSQSLLESQIQAQRTQLLLMKDKFIDLEDKVLNEKHRLKYNGQRIYRISVSHLDYRGFHDKIFINNFMETLLTHSIETVSKEKKIVDKFEVLNEQKKALERQYDEFFKHNDRHNHLPYIGSCFHNLDHIVLMLEKANSSEEFVKLLTSTVYVTATGSLNFYMEFNAVNNIMQNQGSDVV